jgi:serine/threonine protein kinase
VMQEVIILKRIKHKNVVRLFEYFETDKHLLFVIELCAGGDLLNYVRRRRRLKEDVAKCLFKQIIESLAYIHKKNILHRDIKLDNILLDSEGQVKICDFGVGKIVKKGEKMTEQCGTPAYIAPEILRDQGYYGFAVDIWSAGVVLYAMLYGTVPFKASNMSELQKIIMKAKYSLREDISVEARELLKGMMEKDPAKRLTISDIL